MIKQQEKNNKKTKLKITDSVFNKIYFPFLNPKNKNKYNVIYGGSGSGKSVAVTQKIVLDCLAQVESVIVVKKVKETIRGTVFKELKDTIKAFGLENEVTITVSPMQMTFRNGSEIQFYGLDNVDQLKGVKGTKVWIDEADMIEKTDFDQLDLRIRIDKASKSTLQFYISFNPTSDTSWLKSTFFDKEQHNTMIIRSTYLDNKFVSKDYYDTMERIKRDNPEFYRIYAMAEWGTIGDVVYNKYKMVFNEKFNFDYDFYDYLVAGLDFGINDPNALVILGVKEGDIYVLHELKMGGITNNDLIKIINEKFPVLKQRQVPVIADSARPDLILEFQRAGYHCYGVKKGAGSIQRGIEAVRRRWVYMNEDCIETYKEISGYVYMRDKNGRVLNDPVGVNDHLLDALRYAVMDYVSARDNNPAERGLSRSQINRRGRGRGGW